MASRSRWSSTNRRVSTAPRRPQVYFRIYLPLMAPSMVAVGTYALLLAWNEYLYQSCCVVVEEQHDGVGWRLHSS